jgi:hypothetical protein
MSWQIEAVSVEGDKLRKQLANLFDEVAYQLCLGSLANVRRAERVDAPALRLAARDQGANTNDLMKWMLGKSRTKCFPDFNLGRGTQIKHPRSSREIRNGFQVPNNYRLLGHGL